MFIPFGRLFRLLRRKPRPSPFGLDAWQDEEESQEVMVDQEMSPGDRDPFGSWWFAGRIAKALEAELPEGTLVKGEPNEHGVIETGADVTANGPDGASGSGPDFSFHVDMNF